MTNRAESSPDGDRPRSPDPGRGAGTGPDANGTAAGHRPDVALGPALAAIREALAPSPLVHDPALSDCLGRPVHFKLESLLPTGSFKVRGALSRMAGLEESGVGVVACSSGNHGRAVAWAARRLGIPALICLPGWVDPVKRAAVERAGAEARLVGNSYDEAEAEAVRVARETGRVLVHPFDDPRVVAGQGTVGMEILEQCPQVDEVWLPLSGGGLAAGVAVALEEAGTGAVVRAVSARAARVMRASLEAGRPVEVAEEPTLASALAGGIGLENRVTFSLVQELIHLHVEVTEQEIARAMTYGYHQLGLVLEGGGATALAALLSRPVPEGEGPLVVVLSGGNVDPTVLAEVLNRQDGAGAPAD